MNEKIAFIYLPFVAPMMPPLGIPVLISFLEKNGIKSNAYDLNVELYRKFLDENNIENGVCRIKHDLLEENCTEDRRYALLRFLVLEDYIKSNIKQAAKKMSPDGNIATHKELWMNTNIVSKAIEISTYGLWGLNTKSPINLSFEENFRDYIKIFSHTSWENYINWFHKRLDDICKENEYICFSLCYDNQIFFFLEAANYIRAKFKKKIVIGGPVVSSIIRKSSFNIQYDFFEHYSKYIDYLVIGDGEYPLFDLFNKRHNVNVLSYPFKVENHEDCSMQNKVPPLLTPKFSKLPLNLYFTPQLVLPLISARHCYWGRCKFCTHSVGYNEYVKYGVEDIKKCLISLGNDLGAKNFYFVDECMAPSTAKSLANWIEKNNLNISWMTDMRFEKTLANENFIKKLAKGGLKYIAFGMESANERVLKKMEKGTTREVMQNVINNCHKNNINTTLMFFFGFPTETKAEAEDTINFIINNSSKINGIGMGCFTLVPGSFVYNNPKEFGIYAIDENGYYKNTEGMSYEEIRQFFTIWNEYIKKNYYRGHPFYHRIFYLLDLDEKDKWMYPIGLTNFSNIKSLTKKEIKNVDYYLKKTVIAKKICSNDNKSGFDLIYMMDVENIVEVIICIDLKLYDSINSHSLNDGQIRKLYSLGVIE